MSILRELLVNVGGAALRDVLRDAADEFQAFHWGRPAKSARRVRLPSRPRALVEIGPLVGVIYRTAKGNSDGPDDWIHEFGEEGGALPILSYDPDSKDLLIIGGDYDVRPEGIVD